MLAYAQTLLGIPYRWWNPEVSCCDTTGPFWAGATGEVPLPEIQTGHLNCAGLLNVLCRKLGIAIPGAAEGHFYAGGTVSWWDFFRVTGRLEPYVEGVVYPPGSVFLRPFKYAREDEGHIAIAVEDGLILHSWPEKGVVIEKPEVGYYQVVVREFLPW